MKKIYLILTTMAIAVFVFSGCKKDLYSPAVKPTGSKISAANLATTDSTMVMTPVGPRLKSDIHLIENGYSLAYSSEGHIQKIETATGKMIEDFGIPVKKYQSNSKVRAIANVANKTPNNIFPSHVNPDWDAWALAHQYKQGTTIKAFSTTWVVPSLPDSLNDGQIIFIFNGLQTADSSSLLQPVLQYGLAGSGGGAYWSVQNYFIPCYNCSPEFVGTNVRVSPGTTLTGTMTKTASGSNYNYTSSFVGSQYSSNSLAINNQPYNLEYGVETLETYNLKQYNDLPPDSSVKMTSISAGSGNPVTTWTLNNPVTTYGMHIKEPSNGEIDLYFHNPPPPAITYPTPDGYTVNVPITPLNPTNTGGVCAYSISPALPSGLTINASTGVISGTSAVTSPARNYTVTASNSSGSSNFTVNITGWPAPVLTDSYQGHGDLYSFTVTPNIPSPITGVLYWTDLTNGQNNQDAGSPYGFSYSFTYGHQYQVYFIEYGSGSPQNAKSNTVTFTAL